MKDKIEQLNRELLLYQKVNNVFNGTTGLGKALQVIVDEIQKHFNYSACNIYLLEANKKHLVWTAFSRNIKGLIRNVEKMANIKISEYKIPLFKGSSYEKILKTRIPFFSTNMIEIAKDYTDDKRLQKFAPKISKLSNFKSSVKVPLIVNDNAIGILGISSKTVLNKKDISRLQRIAGQVALVIEKTRLYKELEDSELKYKTIVENSPNYVFIHQEGRIKYVNHAILKNLGYAKKEYYSPKFSFTKLIHPNFRKMVYENFYRRLKGDEIPDYGIIILTKSGEMKNVIVKNRAITYEGQPAIEGLLIDVTDLKVYEERIKASEKRFFTFLNTMDDLIYVNSPNYTIEYMNQKMIDHIGRNAVGEKCFWALHNKKEICEWCVNERVKKGETVRWEVASSKDNRTYRVVSYPVYNTDGSISEMASMRDITDEKKMVSEREKLMQELDNKNKELEVLVYSISHDLKSPVISMKGYSEFIHRKYMNIFDETGKKYFNRLESNIKMMEQLIRDLLDFLKIGKISEEKDFISVKDIVKEVISHQEISNKSKKIRFTIDKKLPRIKYNIHHLNRVFANLIDNAVRYMGNQPKPGVRVDYKADKNKHVFSVSDNGIGIPKKYHQEIFKLFSRLKDIETDGTGLGLSIIKKIVESHGGRVWVKSAPGKGSTFYFTVKR